jgi:hypothetical protein
MTEEILARLKDLATRFTESDLAGLRLRWQFGHELLPLRAGKKKLPKDTLARIQGEVGLSPRDIQDHLKFAVRCPTEADYETAVTQYPSWRKLARVGLSKKKPTPRAPRPKHHVAGRLLEQLSELNPEDVPPEFARRLMEQARRLMVTQQEAA